MASRFDEDEKFRNRTVTAILDTLRAQGQLPHVKPPWLRLAVPGERRGVWLLWMARAAGLRVIESVSLESDLKRWHHVSVSRAARAPSWADMMMVKGDFIGDREAYMVAPPASRYVNLHPHALHWWSCLDAPDGEVLPHFEWGANDEPPGI